MTDLLIVFQFMASSLESLVENLVDEKATNKYYNFNNMDRVFGNDKSMLCQKGFYPYEWMDDISKFDHDGLPAKEDFYSSLFQKNQKKLSLI